MKFSRTGQRPHVWMKAGDYVEVEIEELGVLSKTIEDEAQKINIKRKR